MPLLESLKKISQGNQPQTLDELFNQSKEGMMSERLTGQLRALLPQLRGELLAGVEILIKDEVKGQIGAIRVRDGRDGRDGKPGRTPTKNEILEIVKPLLPEEKELEVEKVKGLRGILNELSNRLTSLASRRAKGGGGGGSTVITSDLSSQLDGSTKTFTVTKTIGTSLILVGSQFPTILRPTVDYTNSQTSITLASGVDAPASGQTLIFVYIEG